jgi:hypothetical protein
MFFYFSAIFRRFFVGERKDKQRERGTYRRTKKEKFGVIIPLFACDSWVKKKAERG